MGQCANPEHFLQTGGPGDLTQSINKSKTNHPKGVDRKHGSYDRYLARKVGGILRKERMPENYSKITDKHFDDEEKCYNKNCCQNRIPNTRPTGECPSFPTSSISWCRCCSK